MDFVTRFGLSKSRFTVLMMLLILAMGLSSYLTLPKREDPEITIRTAVVSTGFAGMRPERVEELIAIPMERRMREIGEVEDIETIISTGQVQIKVHLYDTVTGRDIEDAWEDLRNKMAEVVDELPDGTAEPSVNTDPARTDSRQSTKP
ncbi:MAG: efflux RND transporter permease subunit [Pseudomonadota bacterium]